LSFHDIRNMQPPVKIGERTLKDYIFRPPEELYDLEIDPQEVKNLASDPAHRELLLEMREKVTEWQKLTGDLWLYRDGQSITVLSRYAKDGLEIPDRKLKYWVAVTRRSILTSHRWQVLTLMLKTQAPRMCQ
jgi:N-sulfoglucosamine sulfohydrolase